MIKRITPSCRFHVAAYELKSGLTNRVAVTEKVKPLNIPVGFLLSRRLGTGTPASAVWRSPWWPGAG